MIQREFGIPGADSECIYPKVVTRGAVSRKQNIAGRRQHGSGDSRRSFIRHHQKTVGAGRLLRIVSGWFIGALLTSVLCADLMAQSQAGSDGVEVQTDDLSRVVAIGAAVTETIFALGEEEHLVAVDESSSYPADGVAGLEKVSFSRNLNAEGVLSTRPSLIIAVASSGPESAIRQIRSTGTPLLMVTAGETPEDAMTRIQEIGKAMQAEERSEELIRQMEEDLAKAQNVRESLTQTPSVMFIYARGQNNLMVAGDHTSANTMIHLAGGRNVFSDFNGYKPLTAEAVVQANPDVILMMDSGVESVGGTEGVLSSPGVQYTSAATEDRIYSMDGVYLLGFGPRLGSALFDLMELLHTNLDLADL